MKSSWEAIRNTLIDLGKDLENEWELTFKGRKIGKKALE